MLVISLQLLGEKIRMMGFARSNILFFQQVTRTIFWPVNAEVSCGPFESGRLKNLYHRARETSAFPQPLARLVLFTNTDERSTIR
ncbi:MAG: hypothetical protein BM485_01790 [Desulfobulbaceae bacterium DB1]|nr:MAG: hypothetical protein BM485_01790 [Desulfobulbaceae bacterium DB1]